jgi:hypothetical protein
MRLSLIALTALCVVRAAQAAGEPTFAARVERTAVGVGETFSFEITLSVENGRVAGYHAPDFRGFRVVGERPSQSTQMQMGAGGTFVRQVYGWQYELLALDKGTVTIGPARVRVNGRELRTESVGVTVVEAGQGTPLRRPGRAVPRRMPGIPGFDPSDLLAPSGPQPAGGRNFLRVVPSKTKAYVGEQITTEWSLHVTERPDKYLTVLEPRTDGFWVEELIDPNQRAGLLLSPHIHEGKTYQVATLMRKALFPLRPGRLTITPLEAEIQRVDFFGATLRTERIKTEPVAIEVQPLPTAGQPPHFDSAAVGRFALFAEVDRDHVAVGEAVTLKLRITGQGNLRKLAVPPLPRLSGWKTYDPKVSVKLDPVDPTAGGQIGGSKLVEYLLLPERPGVTTIPPFVLSFFDPERATYLTERSAPVRVEVSADGSSAAARPGSAGAATPAAGALPTGPAPGSENVLSLDIRPPRSRPALRRDLGTTFYRSRAFLGVVIVPPLALGLTVLVGVVRDRLSHETEGARRRKLRRLVKRRLRTAEAHLREGRLAQSFSEIERVLREFLSGKLGSQVAGMSWDELRADLARAGLAPALVDSTIAALEDCDRARFAPGGVSGDEVRSAIERAGDIILHIEKNAVRVSPEAEARA